MNWYSVQIDIQSIPKHKDNLKNKPNNDKVQCLDGHEYFLKSNETIHGKTADILRQPETQRNKHKRVDDIARRGNHIINLD